MNISFRNLQAIVLSMYLAAVSLYPKEFSCVCLPKVRTYLPTSFSYNNNFNLLFFENITVWNYIEWLWLYDNNDPFAIVIFDKIQKKRRRRGKMYMKKRRNGALMKRKSLSNIKYTYFLSYSLKCLRLLWLLHTYYMYAIDRLG